MDVPAQLNLEFTGTRRFRVLRRLGEGGMGVVYEALDVETNTRVGLKTITAASGRSLQRFKNEFRALQDIEHHNLVGLHELVHDDGRWFFTMELVEGVDFLRYVRCGDDARAELDTQPFARIEANEAGAAQTAPPPAAYDEARLRCALEQLAHGLIALHRAGKVHRDIKPSNILVDRNGRVVLLDFGLVTDVSRCGDDDLAGTLMFMAPEQGTRTPALPTGDWYSVGMLLYLALTGKEPFAGAPPEVLTLKRSVDPVPPRTLDERVPADLDQLCMALLSRTPSDRPGGQAVLDWLRSARPGHRNERVTARPFVGRTHASLQLDSALADVRPGHPVSVLISGESGVGKTTLVQHFLDQLRVGSPETLVLAGRCYERESVPYKAFDEVIDALGRYLSEREGQEARALIPPAIGHVAQVFPVLRSLVGGVSTDERPIRDPRVVRRSVFTTLRELLRRVGARRPLVIFIDDLHWADEESLLLLDTLLRGADAPGLFLVATLRDALPGSGPEWVADRVPGDVRSLHLPTLAPDEARTLTAHLLRMSSAAKPWEEAAIARAAGGHPLFIEALVQHRLAVGGEGGPVPLDEALWHRISGLPAEARRLLEAVTLAGRPLEQEVAAAAVDLEWGRFSRQLALLRAARLLRTGGPRPADRVEAYHDRVRETVMAHLGAESRRRLHGGLARAFEACRRGDAEELAVHFREADDVGRAVHYFGLAADHAQRALAFDRAARLCRQCLALVGAATPEAHALQIKLGDALANAGRGEGAAAAYQAAAAREPSRLLAIDLERRAAEQLLRIGRIDEATVLLKSVLAAVGLRMPNRPEAALIELGARMALLRVRGFQFRERRPGELGALERARIDTCWSIGCGLTVIDHIRGAVFQERHVMLALRAGEPYRVGRALVVEAFLLATRGRASRALGERITDEAEAIAARLGSPHLDALVHMARAVQAQFAGRFEDARVRWERAEAELRSRCTDVAWEVANTGFFSLQTLAWLGEVSELSRRLPLLIEAAEDRGDRYSASVLRTGWNILPGLAADDPSATQKEVAEAVARWPSSGFHVQHCLALHADVQLALYEGRCEDGRRLLEQHWPGLRRSLLLHIHPLRLDLLFLRMRCTLACAARGPASKEQWGHAERDARRMLQQDRAWSTPLAHLGLAAIAFGRGRSEPAVDELVAAQRGFAACGMALYSAAAQRIHGRLIGGDAGRTAVSGAEQWMAGQGIRSPARLTALLAPGFADAG